MEDMWNMDPTLLANMPTEMLTASKLASSAAHLLGKPRVLVEALGLPLGILPWQVQNGSMIS